MAAAGYGGFAAGAIVGGLSGAASGAINGFGTSLLLGNTLPESMRQMVTHAFIGCLSGALICGIILGSIAKKQGNDFWSGKSSHQFSRTNSLDSRLSQSSPIIEEQRVLAGERIYDLTPSPDESNVTLYRGLTGSESEPGMLFMTDNAEYALSYAKEGLGVVKVTIPKSVLEQMYEHSDLIVNRGMHVLQRDWGTNGVSYLEFGFSASVKPQIVNLFDPVF